MNTKNFLQSGFVLVIAVMITNVFNFGLSAVLGRSLSFEDFGLYTLISSFYYLANIVFMALVNTANHWVAVLSTKEGGDSGISFFYGLGKKTWMLSFLISLFWIISAPFLQSFFKLSSVLPLLLFTPVIAVGPYLSLAKGYFQGMFLFLFAAYIILSEVISKLIFAGIIFYIHSISIIYSIIPLSVCVSVLTTVYLLRRNKKIISKKSYQFPRRFFLAALLSTAASSAFLSIDVIVVKHFLSSSLAGEYALLSLIGKMIYFFESLANVLLISYISKDEAEGKSVNQSFTIFFGISVVLTIIIFIFLGPLGKFFVPLFFGEKAIVLNPFLISYGIGLSFFSLTTTIVAYHLTLHEYEYTLVALLLILLMISGISLFHNNLGQIVKVILVINTLCFGITGWMHIFKKTDRVSTNQLFITE